MMKWLLLVLWLTVVLLPKVSLGQNRTLQVTSKTSFTKLSSQNNSVWEAKAEIKNIGASSAFVTVREVEKNLSYGHKFNYCWGGVCADGETTKSVLPVSIDSKETNSSFRVFLKSTGLDGVSSVTYRFSTANNSDSVDVTFIFNPKNKTTSGAPVSFASSNSGANIVKAELSIQGTVDAFPNPASQQTTLEYKLTSSFQKAYVRIYDLMGKEVAQYDLEETDGNIRVNLRNFNDGVYFFALVADGKTLATKRLVVAK